MPSAAIVASAFITVCVLPLAAQAQIVHFAPHTPIRVGPGQSFEIDLDTSGTVDFTVRMTTINPHPFGAEFGIYLSGTADSATLFRVSSSTGVFGDELVRALPRGGLIGGALDWWPEPIRWAYALEARWVVDHWTGGFLYVDGDWVGVEHAIAPLRFLGSDGLPRFGWLNARSLGPAGAEVLGWAYETTPNSPILAGAIPTPGAAALLALGGVVAARRRR
ncbi:MAG: hypothetical protein SFZ23_08790 [Planctomycetota bacterium]|nr:hypothetical protein [Planctomycetota bacterium]